MSSARDTLPWPMRRIAVPSGNAAVIPFGGVGHSGNGSRMGGIQANLDAYTETQWVTAQSTLPDYPF